MPRKAASAGELPDDLLRALSDGDLSAAAGDAVFKRGLLYFEQRRVKLVKDSADDAHIGAKFKVKGTQTYTTELWLEEAELGFECNCPHADEGAFCKHVVAAGLFWRSKISQSAVANDDLSQEIRGQAAAKKISSEKRQTIAATKRTALRDFVNKQSADTLADRLWTWAEENRAFMGELKVWEAQSRAVQDPAALKSAVTELLKSSAFMGPRECATYARRAEKALDILESTLKTSPKLALSASEHALRRLYKVAETSDDSYGGEIGDLMRDVLDIILRALQAVQPAAQWVDTWFDLLAHDPWGLWSDAMVLDAAGADVQQAYSKRVAKDWQAWLATQESKPVTGLEIAGQGKPRTVYVASIYGRFDYQRSKLRNRYLDDLKRQGDSQTALEVMRASLEDAYEYCDLIAYCETLNKPREALQFAKAAYKRHPADHRCEDALLRCYERDGWDDEALTMRRERLEQSPSSDNYRALLKAAKAAGKNQADYRTELFDWAQQQEAKRPSPMTQRMWQGSAKNNQGNNVSVRVSWLMADNAFEEAMALVQPPHICEPELLLAIARKLPASRNLEAVSLLQRVFTLQMHMAQNPYREVIALVTETSARMPQPARGQWVAWLRAEYKPKRNFVNGFEGVS